LNWNRNFAGYGFDFLSRRPFQIKGHLTTGPDWQSTAGFSLYGAIHLLPKATMLKRLALCGKRSLRLLPVQFPPGGNATKRETDSRQGCQFVGDGAPHIVDRGLTFRDDSHGRFVIARFGAFWNSNSGPPAIGERSANRSSCFDPQGASEESYS